MLPRADEHVALVGSGRSNLCRPRNCALIRQPRRQALSARAVERAWAWLLRAGRPARLRPSLRLGLGGRQGYPARRLSSDNQVCRRQAACCTTTAPGQHRQQVRHRAKACATSNAYSAEVIGRLRGLGRHTRDRKHLKLEGCREWWCEAASHSRTKPSATVLRTTPDVERSLFLNEGPLHSSSDTSVSDPHVRSIPIVAGGVGPLQPAGRRRSEAERRACEKEDAKETQRWGEAGGRRRRDQTA